MKKMIIIIGVISLTAGVTIAGVVTKISADNPKEIYREQLIPEETITCEQENEYLELNNKLVQAMNDRAEGKISEEEYENICKEIYSKVNNKQKEKNIKEQEVEYYENEK